MSPLSPRQQEGRRAEQLAAAYLRRQGYRIDAANVRYPAGELDLIARDGGTLCFIEVRSRAASSFGSALDSITPAKRRRFLQAVRWHLARRPWTGPIRFDVVAIQLSDGGPSTVQLLRNAFTADQ